ncbi:hypothetical protein NX059_000194 [Plenodomus lindquistii]|nr:hypothetical protein NX059_000194 [Plenodomus lindquistii]
MSANSNKGNTNTPSSSSNNNSNNDKNTSMTRSDASRIQSSQAKGGKDMSSKGFAARAQSAADKNAGAGAEKK